MIISFLLFAFVLSVSGCTTLKVLARGNQPIVLNNPSEPYEVLGHFSKAKGVAFDYTGAPDISAMIREGMAPYPNADATINVFITVECSVGDFFFNFFTLGLANAYTLKIEGDAIKYKR